MEFTKHCENKEIVAECIASVFEPVEEGWGTLLAKYVAGITGGLAGTATTTATGGNIVAGTAVAAAVGGAGGYAIHKYITKNLDKLLFQNKEVAKYLKKTCDQILAKKKKELKDNSLSKDVQAKWNDIVDVDELPGFMENLKHVVAGAKNFKALAKELDGYHLYIVCDSDHLERIIFYAQSKNTNKIYGWTVPAPEKGEAAKLFRKEK